MKNSRTFRLWTLVFFLSFTSHLWADNWMSNNDEVVDLARYAPQESLCFVALDLSKTLSDDQLTKLIIQGVETGQTGDTVEGVEQTLGRPIREVVAALGTRVFVSFKMREPGQRPDFIFGLEVRKPKVAMEIFHAFTGIPEDSGKLKLIGESRFRQKETRAFGIHGDYFYMTSSVNALEQVLVGEPNKNLLNRKGFAELINPVLVEQGLVFFGEVPEQLQGLAEVQGLHHILASLGVDDKELLSKLALLLQPDSAITRALLSEGGKLSGSASRHIPKEWGFMASFELRYIDRFFKQLKSEDHEIAREFESAMENLEGHIGLSFQELLSVSSGEVSISTNGLALLPKHYFGLASSSKDDYKILVQLALTDSGRARSMLRKAWKRLGVTTSLDIDGITRVKGTGLAYIILPDEGQLVLSYGQTPARTLQASLSLHESESLAGNSMVENHFPIHNAIAASYLDLEPMVKNMGHLPDNGPLKALLRDTRLWKGVSALSVDKDGLRFSGSGSVPVMVGAGFGAAYFMFGRVGFM